MEKLHSKLKVSGRFCRLAFDIKNAVTQIEDVKEIDMRVMNFIYADKLNEILSEPGKTLQQKQKGGKVAKIFFPQYRKGKDGIEMTEGKSILDYVQTANIEIASECGGLGKCGRCIVRIEGSMECLNEKTEQEKKHSLDRNERLACQARIVEPHTDLYVFIKDIAQQRRLREIAKMYHRIYK